MLINKKFPNVFLRTLSILLLAPFAVYVVYIGGQIFNLFLALVLSILVYEASNIYLKNNDKFSLKKITVFSLMLFYIISAIYLAYKLRNNENGLSLFIWLISSVWICDTFAYLAGNFFQGPKILPSISPNKTWSGFLGGAISVVVFSIVFDKYFLISDSKIIVWSFFIGAVAHLGDFTESYYKRLFGVKDSGNIIPGHGGLLDRADSFLSTVLFIALLNNLGL